MTIQRAAVIGAGVMGAGIARHLASSGCETVVVDSSPEQLERAAADSPAAITFTTDLTATSDSEFVIEAVVEDLDVKRGLLADLKTIVSADVVLATNTSSLLVSDIASGLEHSSRFLGVHYNNPADFNPIVEIIPSALTNPAIADRVQAFYSGSGKSTIRCKDTSGFVLNRQSLPYINEAVRCLDVADAGTIDAVAMQELGAGLGPFAVMNLVGLGVMAAASRNLEVLGDGYTAASALRKQVEQGKWVIEVPDTINAALLSVIRDRLLGAQMFPGKDILDRDLCSRDDLHTICIEALGYARSSPELLEQLPADEVDRLLTLFRG